MLALIADRPAVRAPDLAASLGRDTLTFKRDVRKLKELGLTESLEVGYRISPRGAALLRIPVAINRFVDKSIDRFIALSICRLDCGHRHRRSAIGPRVGE